jgi:hypothetical protein
MCEIYSLFRLFREGHFSAPKAILLKPKMSQSKKEIRFSAMQTNPGPLALWCMCRFILILYFSFQKPLSESGWGWRRSPRTNPRPRPKRNTSLCTTAMQLHGG